MAFVFDATPGSATQNSYLTVAEFADYLETAYEVTESSIVPDDDRLLVLATRSLNAFYSGKKTLVRLKGEDPYYVTAPTWTGTSATTTQALPWPRDGMYDFNGNAILNTVIPQALKDATAELARQMKVGDRTIDSDIAVQGITSIKAGSVAIGFDLANIRILKVIPDAVLALLVPSWLTDEIITPAYPALFDVVSE